MRQLDHQGFLEQLFKWPEKDSDEFEKSEVPKGRHWSPAASALWMYYFFRGFKNFLLRVLQPNTFFVALLIIFAFNFTNRQGFIGFLTLSCFLYVTYYQTLKASYGLRIKREFNSKSYVEMDKVEVTWVVENTGAKPIHQMTLKDEIGMFQNSSMSKILRKHMEPFSPLNIKHNGFADGGMGPKRVGPLEAEVSDLFGIFKFKVMFPKTSIFDVTPKVEKIVNLPRERPLHSMEYGPYETPMSGHNVNFKGIRAYRYGDSLRHIAWKKSAGTGELNVKVFESDINSNVGVILQMNPKFHIGRKAQSTWERARDIAISILSEQLDSGHRFSFLSNSTFIESGQGEQHLYQIIKHISRNGNMDEENKNVHQEVEPDQDLLKQSQLLMRGHHTIYLITPELKPHTEEILEFAKRMALKKINLNIIFVDCTSYLNEIPVSLNYIVDRNVWFMSEQERSAFHEQLKLCGARVSPITKNQKIPGLYEEKGA